MVEIVTLLMYESVALDMLNGLRQDGIDPCLLISLYHENMRLDFAL